MPVTDVRYAVDGWGVGEVVLDGERLLWSELPREGVPLGATRRPAGDSGPNVPQGIPGIPDVSVAGAGSRIHYEFVTNLIARLRRFFAGEPVTFDDVELELDGQSEFYRAVAATLRAVPRGEVVTYGELAALVGRPGAARAAGTFCARNRFSPVVPCHRVVAADGLGQYGSLGLDYKRRLLVAEGWTP